MSCAVTAPWMLEFLITSFVPMEVTGQSMSAPSMSELPSTWREVPASEPRRSCSDDSTAFPSKCIQESTRFRLSALVSPDTVTETLCISVAPCDVKVSRPEQFSMVPPASTAALTACSPRSP